MVDLVSICQSRTLDSYFGFAVGEPAFRAKQAGREYYVGESSVLVLNHLIILNR